jgi:hypothetical protein
MTMLELAWKSGASVPYPVERTDDGVVMEYIGDLAAPGSSTPTCPPTTCSGGSAGS